MKKLFVAVALVLGVSTMVVNATEVATTSTVMVMGADGQPIELSDLPEAVANSIAKNFGELTAKSATVEVKEDGSKIYKVVLADSEGNGKEVNFNEEGEIQE